MYAKFEHKPDRIFTDFREIRKEIENRTKELVQNKNVCLFPIKLILQTNTASN